MNTSGGERGFALLTMLILMALLMALLLTHFGLTWVELSTTRSSMNSFVGFYAAEAGLNLRAEQVRQTFVGFSQPTGSSPTTTDPCVGSNLGSADFACVNYAMQHRNIVTYMRETTASALPIVIPRGETYGNLQGRENHYAVFSTASNAKGSPEAVLEVHFMSRDVPLFQFAAFYGKDLEILPATAMTIEGPIHSNGDLYLGTGASLDITNPVTVAGNLYRGRKDADTCLAGPVRVSDPDDLTELPACSSGREQIVQMELTAWNMAVNVDVTPLTVPPATVLDPVVGASYWDRADLRVVLDLNAAPTIEVRNVDGSKNVAASTAIGVCAAASHTATLYNQREALTVQMLDVDLQQLINCAHSSALMGATALNDSTDGGLVWYFGVDGPDSAIPNGYGVRIANGAELVSTVAGAPAIRGLTIATDQALYVKGNFNTVNKKPAAFLADSFNVLSGSWSDGNSPLAPASDTTIQAAILAGTDTTGGADGSAGQDAGGYNGGLENFMRLHEDWTGRTLTYLGSFVSLFAPRHVDGPWALGAPYYTAPARNWVYEDEFDDATFLPPLTPTFVYLKQELFVRKFEL